MFVTYKDFVNDILQNRRKEWRVYSISKCLQIYDKL